MNSNDRPIGVAKYVPGSGGQCYILADFLLLLKILDVMTYRRMKSRVIPFVKKRNFVKLLNEEYSGNSNEG